MSSLSALLLLGLCLQAAALPGDAYIHSFFPKVGSLEGGTELTILGAGFERSNVSGQTLVFIGNMLCPIDYYKSSDSKLLCSTPQYRFDLSSLMIRVVLLSVDSAGYARCPSGACFFQYRSDRTPYVQRMLRAAGSYELLAFDGYLRGLSGSQYEIKINEFHCIIDDAAQVAQNWGSYVMTGCKMPLLTAGVYNVSLLVQESNIGAGKASLPAQSNIGEDWPYDLKVYPVINSLSTNLSGTNGGQTLTVFGSGFEGADCAQNTIIVSGVPCNITQCTQTTLSCVIGPAPQTLPSGPFASSRGLLHRIYYNLYGSVYVDSMVSHPRFPNSPDIIRVNAEGLNGYGVNFADNYGELLEGYFVPKVTAHHMFYISADDGCDLFISFNNTVSNLTRIAYSWTYSPTYWFNPATQISRPLLLQAGRPYMIRARHAEGYGGDFLKVAVRIMNPPPRSPLEIKQHSVHERQILSFTSSVRREVQRLNFTAPDNSTSISGSFMFYTHYLGVRSPVINITTASNSEVANAVARIMSSCSSIGVFRRTSPGFMSVAYDISINCPTVDAYPEIRVDRLSLNVAPTWERVRNASVPIRGTFQVGFNGAWAAPMNYNDNGNVMAARLASLNLTAVASSYNDPNDGIAYSIDISLPVGNLPFIDVNMSGLTGDGVNFTVTSIEHGSADAFYDPIPADYLFFPTSDVPNVVVTTNGITATCSDPSTSGSRCGLRYVAGLTPQVTSVSTANPSNVLVGDVFTIAGSGFGSVNESVVVSIGQGACTVTALSDTAITCVAGDAPQGLFVVSVLRTDVGLATVAADAGNNFTYGYRVDSFEPASGAPAGGNVLTIRGTGFGPAAGLGVTVGGYNCTIVSATFNTVQCVVPSAGDLSNVYAAQGNNTLATVTVGQFGQSANASYLYDWALQPVVTDVQPRLFSAGVTTMINLTGDFSLHVETNNSACQAQVLFGTHPCINIVISPDATSISCALVRGNVQPIGAQLVRPRVLLCTSGEQVVAAHNEPGVATEIALRITNLSKTSASIAGSTEIVISGAGFISNRRNRLSVAVVSTTNSSEEESIEVLCTVSFSTFSTIVCNLSSISTYENASLTGTLRVLLNGVEAMCNDCSFFINASSTPLVFGMENQVGFAGSVFTANGTYLTNDTHVMFGPFYCTPISYEVVEVYSYEEVVINVTIEGEEASSPDHNSTNFDNGTNTDNSTTVYNQTDLENSTNIYNQTDSDNSTTFVNNTDNSTDYSNDPTSSQGSSQPDTTAIPDSDTTESDTTAIPENDTTESETTVVPDSDTTESETTAIPDSNNQTTVSSNNITSNNVTSSRVRYNTTTIIVRRLVKRYYVFQCRVPEMPAGVYPVRVHVDGLGDALHVGNCTTHTFTSLLRFDSLSPRMGSLGGGTTVTISGAGFSPVLLDNWLVFGTLSVNAYIVSSSYSTIVAVTPFQPTSVNVNTTTNLTITVQNADYGNRTRTASPQCPTPSLCTFLYTPQLTSTVTALSPTSGTAGTLLRVTGTGFGTSLVNGTIVEINNVLCTINASGYSNTQFFCRLGNSPAGPSWVYVTIPGRGTARTSIFFTPQLAVTSFSPTSGGFGGGQTVDVVGSGFGYEAAGSQAFFCGRPCAVTASAYNALRCVTSDIATNESVVAFNIYDTEELVGTSSQTRAFDNDYDTSQSSCPITFDLGTTRQAHLKQINFFPVTTSFSVMNRGWFEVSANNVNWTTVGTITEARAGWNTMDVSGTSPVSPVRYIRYRHPTNCLVAELEFLGIPVQVTEPTVAGSACRLNVSVNVVAAHPCHGWVPNAAVRTATTTDDSHMGGMTVMSMMPGMASMFTPSTTTVVIPTIAASLLTPANLTFLFTQAQTSVVRSVSPRWGTALGGTEVTIYGNNLPTVLNRTTAVFNGVSCQPTAVSSDGSWVRCITGAKTDLQPAVMSVGLVDATGSPAGLCLCNTTVRFDYLDRWSDLTTWSDEELPIEGDTVIIPADQRVLLDISPPRLFVLLVQGTLVFDRKDLALNASYIFIPGGKMQVGTEDEPFLQRATITLHGDRMLSIELPHIGSKVLAVSNKNLMDHHTPAASEVGQLDIHGAPRLRTWTKVASDALAGTTTIVAAEDVDFAAGDKIVLTTGESHWQIEELVVADLASDKRTITVTEPLRFTHESRVVQVAGRTVDMRCEVGLLSRNVVIQGEDGSEAQMFGVHTMAVHGGIYRIENAEVRRCGQAFNMGRYCIHFHMAGEERHCYARSNSIHHSFQRAVTIHGTNNLRVQHNFAYHVMGHNFFVEDGGERYNYIEENLGARTLQSFALLKSDTKPATFWTSSPTNYWRHNVAAGSTHDGFWFELPGNPGGPSFTTAICPVGERIGQFYNNTAHSNGVHGLRIYPVYTPHQDPCNAASPSAPQFFHNFTSFHNGQHGIFGKRNGDLHHVGAILVENGDDEFFQVKYEEVDYSNIPNLHDVLLVGSLTGRANGKHAMTTPQNEFFYVSGATMVNYGSAGAIAGCADCNSDENLRQGGYTVRFERLTFINSPVRTHWNEPRKDILVDLDGTLTGYSGVGGTVTPFYGFNAWPECPRGGAMFKDGLVCNSSVQVRRLQLDAVDPRELDFQVIRLTSGAGSGTVRFRPKESYGWVIPIVNGHEYKTSFVSLVDWERMRIRYSEPEYVIRGEWTTLSYSYIDYRYTFDVFYSDTTRKIASFPDQSYSLLPTHNWGTSLTNPINQSFDVILATGQGIDLGRARMPGPYSLVVKPIQCAPDNPTCGFTGDVALEYPPLLWSSPNTWASRRVPACNEDVVIPAGKIIQLDVNPCKLKNLVIYGKLQFIDSADRWLQVDSILVYGFLEVGLLAAPFTNRARISISGVRTSPTVIVSNDLFIGNKVIANFGRIDMVGRARAVPWTRLAVTANAGDRVLRLAQSCDWVAGDAIAITPTEYGAAQTENVTVAAVSGDGRTVNLTSALRFRHFAGLVDDGRGNLVQLAAAVGVLTRNIVIEGVLSSANDVYGAHIFVADATFSSGVRKQGSVFLNGVEFRNTGKQAMQYASVMFQYSSLPSDEAAWPVNVINGSAFSYSLNYGVVSFGSRGVNLTNNVFHRTFRTAIDADGATQAMTMVGNLIVGNYRSPDDPDDWARPFAGFYLNTRSIRSLQNNVVGGTDDSGYVIFAETCGVANPVVFNNEVHAALIGVFLLPTTGMACGQHGSTVAWKCAHVGFLTVDQTANMVLTNVTVADSHIGISLNYIRGGQTGRTDIQNSRIFGSTDASTCAASVTCRAVSAADVFGNSCQSVFGSGYRRVGVVVPQYLNRPKTCIMDGGLPVCRPPTTPERMCSLPWEKRYGLPTTDVHAELYLTNTVFGYFQPSDCGRVSVGLTLNPTQVDYTPHIFASGITWVATNDTARMQLGLTNRHPQDCQTSCDSTNYALANDIDGSLFSNTAGATLMGQANPLLARNFPECTSYSDVGVIHCPTMRVSQAMLSNNDLDRGSRKFGPVRATKFGVGENRTVWSQGPYDDHCPMRFFFGQYPFALEAGQTYFIYTTGTMPSNSRFQYFSTNSNDVVLIRLFYTKPYSISVFNNGAKVNALTTGYPTLSSPRGTNALDPQQRVLYLTLRGGSTVAQQTYDLVTESNVQLTLALKITEQEFFGPTLITNLATLLRIPASRIKIVAVHALGTRRRLMQSPSNSSNSSNSNSSSSSSSNGISVQIQISPPQPTASVATNATALQANIAAQQSLMNQVASVSSSGALSQSLASSGIPLASVVITPPPGVGASSSNAFSVPIEPSSPSSETSSTVYIAVGSAVGAVGFLIGLVVWAKRQKVMAVITRNTVTPTSSPTSTPPVRIVVPEVVYDNPREFDGNVSFYDNVSVRNSLVETPPLLFSSSELSMGQPVNDNAFMTPAPLAWSRPDLNREAANRLLASQPVGTFLVYGKGPNALALKNSKQVVQHISISRLENALPRFRLAVDDRQPWHNDMEALVKYYRTPRECLGNVGLTEAATRPFPSPRPTRNTRLSSQHNSSPRPTSSPSSEMFFAQRGSLRTAEALESFRPTLLQEADL
eukprot:m.224971 g.224971  ORF g.224971 m.224971 type:complete len:4030 (+) comp16594_c0_seq1:296-12385(+)